MQNRFTDSIKTMRKFISYYVFIIALLHHCHGRPSLVSVKQEHSQMYCVNGLLQAPNYCSCWMGFTGQSCDIALDKYLDEGFKPAQRKLTESSLKENETKREEAVASNTAKKELLRKQIQNWQESSGAEEIEKEEQYRMYQEQASTIVTETVEFEGSAAAYTAKHKIGKSTLFQLKLHGGGDRASELQFIHNINFAGKNYSAFSLVNQYSIKHISLDEDRKEKLLDNLRTHLYKYFLLKYFNETRIEEIPTVELHSDVQEVAEKYEIFIENDVECINGVEKRICELCSCSRGYSGEFCENGPNTQSSAGESFIEYEGSGNEINYSGHGSLHEKCIHGIPIYINSCLCRVGHVGVSCDIEEKTPVNEANKVGIYAGDGDETASGDELEVLAMEEVTHSGSGSQQTDAHGQEDLVWHHNDFDHLDWRLMGNLSRRISGRPQTIFEDKFVAVADGVNGTKTELHYVPVPDKSSSNMYRFTFVPHQDGGRSRLELTTCFSYPQEDNSGFETMTSPTPRVDQCTMVKSPIEAVHTYKYQMYLPRKDFSDRGKYIITQWHGSADGTILLDEYGCIAQVSQFDLIRLCTQHLCNQGKITDNKGRYIGLQYVQGGYPPLILSVDKGVFLVRARSDSRVFMKKRGCPSGKALSAHYKCPNHPQQQHHLLLRMPFDDFPFDQWVNIEWKVKWGEYGMSAKDVTRPDTDPGILLSDAWIRLWIGDKKVVDWTGPCGRNDNNRVPYFKAGIYNPSGSKYPLRFYVRNYEHDFAPPAQLSAKDRNVLRDLRVVENGKAAELTVSQNTFNNALIFERKGGDGTCVLRPSFSHLATLLQRRFSKLDVDKETTALLKTMVFALQAQESRLAALERIVNQRTNEDHKAKRKRKKKGRSRDHL